MIARNDMYISNKLGGNPKRVLGAGDCWVKRTVGGTTAPGGNITVKSICDGFLGISGINFKIKSIMVWTGFGFELNVQFDRAALTTITDSNNPALRCEDFGSANSMAKARVHIPYAQQKLIAFNNTSTTVLMTNNVATAPIYWRAQIKFQC